MTQANILVVVIDGLRASALGAYGNTTFATPSLDQFAAESFLLDACFAPSAELPSIYRALWRSEHPARPLAVDHPHLSLPRRLGTLGYETTLIFDEPQLASSAVVNEFSHCVDLTALAKTHKMAVRAAEVSQSACAQLFAAACEAVESAPLQSSSPTGKLAPGGPRLVWIHSRGMYGPWDAPLEMQLTLLDEGDPPPLESAVPPDVLLTAVFDPDTVFQSSCAYAAQVMVLDTCWAGLMSALRSRPADEPWLVTLLGARGFPLGEHQRVGGIDERLYSDQVRVPWIVQLSDGRGRLARTSALVTHADLLPTLVELTDGGKSSTTEPIDGRSILPLVTGERTSLRDALLSVSDSGSQSFRTADWCLRQGGSTLDERETEGGPASVELFVRPDDRWEANDVAKLCPEIVEALADDAALARVQVSQNVPLAPRLPPEIDAGM